MFKGRANPGNSIVVKLTLEVYLNFSALTLRSSSS